jgi:hypothetical protein
VEYLLPLAAVVPVVEELVEEVVKGQVQFFQVLHQPVAVVAVEVHLPQLIQLNPVDPVVAEAEKNKRLENLETHLQ